MSIVVLPTKELANLDFHKYGKNHEKKQDTRKNVL